MCASMAGFAINDVIMKFAFAKVPLFQAIFWRGLFAILFIAAIAWWFGALKRQTEWRHFLHPAVALRTLAEIGATTFFLSALFAMPIANATAILQALPLTITLAAALLLGETVGWRRYSAIAVGLIGVMLIVQPGADGFAAGSGWALLAVGAITMRDLATRFMPDALPSLLVGLLTAVVITLAGAVGTLVGDTVALGLSDILRLGSAAAFLGVGYVCSVLAMRHGDVGFVSPFRYTILLWALVLGWAVFGNLPNSLALLGSVIVVASGLYTFVRERSARKAAAASL